MHKLCITVTWMIWWPGLGVMSTVRQSGWMLSYRHWWAWHNIDSFWSLSFVLHINVGLGNTNRHIIQTLFSSLVQANILQRLHSFISCKESICSLHILNNWHNKNSVDNRKRNSMNRAGIREIKIHVVKVVHFWLDWDTYIFRAS
jgi:hypothetical protein